MNIAQNPIQTQSSQIDTTRKTTLLTALYTPAHTSPTQQSLFTTNTIHTNPQLHPTTLRTVSRSPLPTILNNQLSYN